MKQLIVVFVVVLIAVLVGIYSSAPQTTLDPLPSETVTKQSSWHASPFSEDNTETIETGHETSFEQPTPEVIAFLSFQQEIIDLQEKHTSMSVQERQTAARALLAELPNLVRSGHVLPIQALALSHSLIDEAATNVADRAVLASDIRAQIEEHSVRSVGDSPENDPRYQQYQVQSTSLIEDVTRTHPPEQQQGIIADRLQKLREHIYGDVPSN